MKICIICFDFKKENIRRQPWVYIHEMCEYFSKNNVDYILITNTMENLEESKHIRTANKIYSLFGESDEVLQNIDEEEPDVVICLLGMTTFLKLRTRIKKPIFGVLTSPIYSIPEITRVGLSEFLIHFKYIYPHLLGSLLPRWLIRGYLNPLRAVVVLNNETKKRLDKIGVRPKTFAIAPGINEIFLSSPNSIKVEAIRKRINPESVPVVMYFTSPLTIRGTDTLIKAFALVRKEIPCKLVFLSRLEQEGLAWEESILLKLAEKLDIENSIEFISQNLRPEEIRDYLSVADIVCLPFKVVISDVPISILEGMAVAKPVVSTNVSGIPDLIGNRSILTEPNDPVMLAGILRDLIQDNERRCQIGGRNLEYIKKNISWGKNGEEFMRFIHGLV